MEDNRFLFKAKYSESYALIVGINNYKNASPLSYAVHDAMAIRDILIENFSFPEDNIVFLSDEAATSKKISQQYQNFTTDKVNVDDRIVIFFAGHGHTREGMRGDVGYLVPYDANIDDPSSLIRWDFFSKESELIRAKHILFIMDACYSGLALNRTLQPGSTRFLKDMMCRWSRQVLTAGKANEVVADSGGPIPNHSVFTGHLIEGLKGKAYNENGVLTANMLMFYVYSKVATDKNSNQTPHYGYFDGDGDFVFKFSCDEAGEKDSTMIVINAPSDDFLYEKTPDKVDEIKKLLSNDSTSIKVHDYLMQEVRRLLAAYNDDNFSPEATYSVPELHKRIKKYEEISIDISVLCACVAYWAKPEHNTILPKVFARSTDFVEHKRYLDTWDLLNWYPIIIALYCSGIAAIDAKRYDSLANIFNTVIETSDHKSTVIILADIIVAKIREINRYDLFNGLPGYEKFQFPMIEYLFKMLQPKLDDFFFIGKSYESSFDEFEVFLALVYTDINFQHTGSMHVHLSGRFFWKLRYDNNPLKRILDEGRKFGEKWLPIQAGLFGGSLERFLDVAERYQKVIDSN